MARVLHCDTGGRWLPNGLETRRYSQGEMLVRTRHAPKPAQAWVENGWRMAWTLDRLSEPVCLRSYSEEEQVANEVR